MRFESGEPIADHSHHPARSESFCTLIKIVGKNRIGSRKNQYPERQGYKTYDYLHPDADLLLRGDRTCPLRTRPGVNLPGRHVT